MDGWKDGWKDGWMDGRMNGEARLRIAYSNQNTCRFLYQAVTK